ncbi:MAG TPA: enoyl-CoA hydratase/isomerase family protein, partial [Candidatus Polarisedimenticolia bacterium]|nr:enoyl-CoA hydratase/isomerase family protein [Candidatus Polarisedimenticolia bacterium]
MLEKQVESAPASRPGAGAGRRKAGSGLRCEVEKGVASLTLARPAARNALTLEMIEALHAALDRIEDDPTVRLVVLRGEGDHLCAGADVKGFLGAVEAGAPEEADFFLAREYALDLRLARLPIPLVTIADGIAMGGGLGLAFGGYIVATTRARFAMPESRLGFLPDIGATCELKRRLGLPLARYLAWTGETFGGDEALRWGFADVLIEPDQAGALLATLGRMARGEAGQRMNGSAEIAYLQARVAGGVPAHQGRWARRGEKPAEGTAQVYVARHFSLDTPPDILRSLQKAADRSEDRVEREWALRTLETLKRRSPVSIWAADLLLRLDYDALAREAASLTGRSGGGARTAAGGAAAGPDWLAYLREELGAAEIEVGELLALERPTPRHLALAFEFLFATAMFRHPDFVEGVRAFRDKREPDFPSAREALGVHRALFTERSGWTLLRHAARLARDPFWIEVARQELDWIEPPRQGYDGSTFPCVRWFADGRLNASVEALDRWVERGRGGQTAFLWEGDRIDSDRRPLEQRAINYADLLREVQRCAAALRALGMKRGDSLVLYMPNIIETYVVQLAAARLGVVYHPVFAGFAREELSDRLHMMGARVLVTVDGAFRKGEVIQYQRDFVDPALRDFVPVESALEAAAGLLPGAAALERVREMLADKVTVEKAKFLDILSREIAEERGRASGRGAPASDDLGDRSAAGHGSGNLESLILGRSDASGDPSMVERIDRAARLLDRHDSEGRGTEQAGLLRAIAGRLDLLKSQVEKVVVLRR